MAEGREAAQIEKPAGVAIAGVNGDAGREGLFPALFPGKLDLILGGQIEEFHAPHYLLSIRYEEL